MSHTQKIYTITAISIIICLFGIGYTYIHKNTDQKLIETDTTYTAREGSCFDEYVHYSETYEPLVYEFKHKYEPLYSYTEFRSGFELTTPFTYSLHNASSSMILGYISTSTRYSSVISQYTFLENCTDIDSLQDTEKLDTIYDIIIGKPNGRIDMYLPASGLADQIEYSFKETVDHYTLISPKEVYINTHGIRFIISTYNIYTTDNKTYIAASAIYVKGSYFGFIGFSFPKLYIQQSHHSSIIEYTKELLDGVAFIKPETYNIVPVK